MFAVPQIAADTPAGLMGGLFSLRGKMGNLPYALASAAAFFAQHLTILAAFHIAHIPLDTSLRLHMPQLPLFGLRFYLTPQFGLLLLDNAPALIPLGALFILLTL